MSSKPSSYSLSRKFNKAVDLHNGGRLDEAIGAYEAILKKASAHSDALHHLGLAVYQQGDAERAAALIQKAISIDSGNPSSHSNLGNVLKALGRREEALASFGKAMELDPSFMPAFYNAGEVYCALERYEEGEEVYRKALAIDNSVPEIWANLGLCLVSQQKLEEAEQSLREALRKRADFAPAVYGLAQLKLAQQEFDEAAALYFKSLEAGYQTLECLIELATIAQQQDKPEHVIAYLQQLIEMGQGDANVYNNLGLAYVNTEQNEKAQEAYETALRLDASHVETLCNYSSLLHLEGNVAEAVARARKAVEIDAQSSIAWNNLGNALRDALELSEAAQAYRRALEIEPGKAEYCNNLALACDALGDGAEAEKLFRQAMNAQPGYVAAQANFAACLIRQGRLTQAKEILDALLQSQPDYAPAWSSLGRLLFESGDYAGSEQAYCKCLELEPGDSVALMALPALSIARDDSEDTALFELHALSARFAEEGVVPNAFSVGRFDKKADERLRVGFVSADLKKHSVAYFLMPLLKSLDRERFEVYAYSSAHREDEVTQEFKSLFDNWRNVLSLPDQRLAETIQEDSVDILVDLSGYTAGSKLGAFAYRPAPAQVSWLGYAHSTGMERIQYRIGDANTDPDGITLNSEAIVNLSPAFLCYEPLASAPAVTELPAKDKGFVTFGSFNNIYKFNATTARLFASALKAVPDSRLLLKSHQLEDTLCRERVLALMEAEGIARERVELLGRIASTDGHLAAYGSVDIALDTYPYNGTTTTCEALWMGVPVISLCGSRHASRVSRSILNTVGLGEFSVESEEAFTTAASKLAVNLEDLQAMRLGMRDRIQGSPLLDAEAFASSFGEALEAIWEHAKSVSG